LEQLVGEHQMAVAADGEELGDSLDDGQQDDF
jgi:hypothetical protein